MNASIIWYFVQNIVFVYLKMALPNIRYSKCIICVVKKKTFSVLELNVQDDHVHLVLSIAPKYSVSSIMGFLKGKLSQKLFRQYDSFGRQYWGRHLWARGYSVSTIGLDEDMIRKYVKWQEKREREIENQQKNK